MRKRIKGFTLVELLVVIGVIGVLIALLLPVLGTARKNAAKSKCGNNLGQIKGFLGLYTTDNDGLMPAQHFTFGGNQKYWMEAIYTEWDHDKWVEYYNDMTIDNLPKVFQCPSADPSLPACYSSNWYVMTKVVPSGPIDEVYTSQIENGATTIVISDGIQANMAEKGAPTSWQDWEHQQLGGARTLHLGGMNLLTLGGAVKFFQPTYNDADEPQDNVSTIGLNWEK